MIISYQLNSYVLHRILGQHCLIMINLERITPEFIARHPEALSQRPLMVSPQILPVIYQETFNRTSGGDIDHLLGDSSEDYVRWCIQPLLSEPNVTGIVGSEHNSLLDRLGIDIAVLYTEELPTFIQVATSVRKTKKKMRQAPEEILVINAFDSPTSLTPPEFVLEVVREWRINPGAAQNKVRERMRNPPIDFAHPPHKMSGLGEK